MLTNEARKRAEAEASHVLDDLLPEIARENRTPATKIAYLVVSAAMSSKEDHATQVEHLSKPGVNWDADLVNKWARQSAGELDAIVQRFERGETIGALARELSRKRPPVPAALVQDKVDLVQHLAALLELHGGEVSYYDHSNGDELLLVCLVNTTEWR